MASLVSVLTFMMQGTMADLLETRVHRNLRTKFLIYAVKNPIGPLKVYSMLVNTSPHVDYSLYDRTIEVDFKNAK